MHRADPKDVFALELLHVPVDAICGTAGERLWDAVERRGCEGEGTNHLGLPCEIA